MTKHLIDRAFRIGPKLPKEQRCPSCSSPRHQLCRIEVKNKTGWVYYNLNDEGLDLDFTIELDETDSFANRPSDPLSKRGVRYLKKLEEMTTEGPG